MTDSRINFAIIGTNFISDRFCEAVTLSKGARAIAVYSRTEARGEDFASRNHIERVYTSLDEMLSDSDIDAVYIASPTFCHAEQAIAALNAGKHVLCEKMIAINSSELKRMMDAAEANGRILIEAMRPDFDGAFCLIEKELPRLGKIRRVSFDYCQYSSRYDRFKSGEILNAFDPELKNSALADIGIYPLHMCVYLFGEPSSIVSTSIFLSNGFEGAGTAILNYGDMLATINYSKISDNRTPSVIEGELGSILIDKINSADTITVKLRSGEQYRLAHKAVSNNMYFEIDAFCDIISGKLDYRKYLSVSRITMSCVDKIYASSSIFDRDNV